MGIGINDPRLFRAIRVIRATNDLMTVAPVMAVERVAIRKDRGRRAAEAVSMR